MRTSPPSVQVKRNRVSIRTGLIAVLAFAWFSAYWIAIGEQGTHLLPVVQRTWVMGLSSGYLAALVAVPLAFYCRTGPRTSRVLIGFGACTPIAFAPLTLATALVQEPFNLDPYGSAVIVLSQALANLPIAFLLQVGTLMLVHDNLIFASATLGLEPRRTARRLFGSRRRWSFVVSGMVASLFAASDPSVSLVYGGTQSYLASHIYRGLNAGMQPGAAIGATLALLLPAVFLAIYLTRTITSSWSASSLLAFGQSDVSTYFGRQRLYQFLSFALLALIGLVLVVIVVGALGVNIGEVLNVSTVLTTLVTVIAIVVSASLVGLWTARLSRRGSSSAFVVSFVLILSFLVSQTAIGMILSSLLRNAVIIGHTPVLPSLVGGGAFAGGYIAVGIAYLSIAAPIAHLTMSGILRSTTDLYDAALDNGAGRLRSVFTVLPAVAPRLVAMMAILSGIILTRLSPILFVQPPGYAVPSTNLLTLASAGWDEHVFALGVVSAIIPVLAFAYAATHEFQGKGRKNA